MNKNSAMTGHIQQIAHTLLEQYPDPIPKFLILRDILRLEPGSSALQDAKQQVLRSKWVQQLASEQNSNGGWSRFHSMNTKVRHKISTTEYAIYKALSIGLTREDTILAQAQSYLEGLLTGVIAWPEDEGKEPNDRWPTGEEMFVAATLAMIDPRNPLLETIIEKWCHIAEATFASHIYDPIAEWRTHCRLTGATTMRSSYLVINNQYALILLSRAGNRLNKQTEQALLDWVWHHQRGVGYLNIPLQIPIPQLHPREFGGWFASHWILSRFDSWLDHIKPDIDTLWSLQMPNGFWNFGMKASQYNFHLSESWRKPVSQQVDGFFRPHIIFASALLQ